MLSLTGKGGIWKTEIALELCHRERTTYSVIIWINAVDETHFTEGLVKFASKLSTGQRTFNNHETSLAYIQEVAKNRTQPWLFVFDDWNLADWNPNLFHFLADGGQRDVVVTTSRSEPSWGTQIQVQPLSEKDAVKYLLDLSLSSSPDQVEASRVLAKKSDYLPLSLSLISGAMRTRGFTPKRYLEQMEKSRSTEQMNHSKALSSAFDLFHEGFKTVDSRLVDFLLQLSFIPVPAEFMFRDYFLVAQSRGESLPSFYQLLVSNKQWSPDLFLHAVQQLCIYSLLRQELVGESGVMILSMHKFVKHFLHDQMLPTGVNMDLQLMLQATAIIAASLLDHDWEELSFYHRPIFRENISECVQRRKSMISGPNLIKRYSGISEGYQTAFAAFLAMYSNKEKLARDLLLQSLSLQSTWLGESASLTCTTMTWLALLYLESMSLDEAETMTNRLNIAESQTSKPQRIFLVDVQFLQGHLQMRKQNIDHALSIFKHCTESYANIAGISSLGTASVLISGVEAMLMQGNIVEATQSLYEAECIQKDIGSPCTLAIRVKWNMARHSLRMGDHIRATSRYQDLCEEHETNHDQVGPPSHRWESLCCELGDVYLDLGDIQKAEAQYDIGRASASRRSRSLKIHSRDISQCLIYGSLERTKIVPVPYLRG